MSRTATCAPSRAHASTTLRAVSRPVHDATVLRAIAHPVRNRILDELTATGSMRAADIARELTIPANQASFHLRQLAKYGLVEEDPDAARDKRDRVWRATSPDGYDIDVASLQDQPGGRAASQVFLRSSADWAHVVVEQAYRGERSSAARQATVHHAIRLTQDEAGDLADELDELAQRWTERTRGRDDERRTYLLHSMLLPYPEVAGHDPAVDPLPEPEDL